MNPVITRDKDVNSSRTVLNQRTGAEQLPLTAPVRSPFSQRLAVSIPTLDPVTAEFAYENRTVVSEHQIVRILHLACLATLLPPHPLKISLAIKNLDTMIARIGYPDLVSVINRQVLRAQELPRL